MNIPLDRLNDTLMVTWGLPDRIQIIVVNIPLDRLNATLVSMSLGGFLFKHKRIRPKRT